MWELSASLKVFSQGNVRVILPAGDWNLSAVAAIDRELRNLVDPLVKGGNGATGQVRMAMESLGRLDTAGAWLIARTIKELEAANIPVELIDADDEQKALIDLVRNGVACEPSRDHEVHAIKRGIEHLGQATVRAIQEGYTLIAFFGAVVWTLFVNFFKPSTWRITAIFHHLEHTGVNAIPIVTLMSFLIGIVLAYQGSSQLTQFGAEIFTVNLLAVSVLRELGILMTAIVVAGRSGSAFAAQIGMMKVNQEIDAMRVIGLDPLDVLVMPRLIALMIALPLLFFLAIVSALVGGALVVVFGLDIPMVQFIRQLQSAVGAEALFVGLVKAPVFAFLIALVGCFEGLQVENNADSVGVQTTKAVVVTIFLVIVVDAIFSILFSVLGI